VDSSEIVEAKFKMVWQLVCFKGQLDAETAVGTIVHDAKVSGLAWSE
jgi:hypothetical protein